MVNLRDRTNRSTSTTPRTTLQSTAQRTGNVAARYASRNLEGQSLALRSRGSVASRLNNSQGQDNILDTIGNTLTTFAKGELPFQQDFQRGLSDIADDIVGVFGDAGKEVQKFVRGELPLQKDFQQLLDDIPKAIGDVLTGQTAEAERARQENAKKIQESGVQPKPVQLGGTSALDAVTALVPAAKLAGVGSTVGSTALKGVSLAKVPEKISVGGAKSGTAVLTSTDTTLKLGTAGAAGAAMLGMSEMPNKIGNEYNDVYEYWKNRNSGKNKRGYKSGEGNYVPSQSAGTTAGKKRVIDELGQPTGLTALPQRMTAGDVTGGRTSGQKQTGTRKAGSVVDELGEPAGLMALPQKMTVSDVAGYGRKQDTGSKNRRNTVNNSGTRNVSAERTRNANRTREETTQRTRNIPVERNVEEFLSELPVRYEPRNELERPRDVVNRNPNRFVNENENVFDRPVRNETRFPFENETVPGRGRPRPRKRKIPDIDIDERKKKKRKTQKKQRKYSVVGVENPLPWLSPSTGNVVQSKPKRRKR